MEERRTTRPLPIEDAADLLLVLLYVPGKSDMFGEPIVGTTRLQKLFFLLRQGDGPNQLVREAQMFDYTAYKMGPFSEELRNTVQELEAAGIIDVQQLDYLIPDDSDEAEVSRQSSAGEQVPSRRAITSFTYALSSDLGMRIGADLWAGLDERTRNDLKEFKRFFNSISLRQLLIFTYEKYPNYTTRSTIREQLGF